jgi:colanic acid biosynthesis glycosyl transferase WcaI
MRILVLILQFPPDVNAAGRLMSELCDGLVERGHEVSVVTTFPHYAEFRISDTYRGKLAQRARHNGVEVLRLWVHASGRKQRMLDRFLSYASYTVLAAVACLLDIRRYDVILCSNGGFLPGLAAVLVGALKRTPFVLNVQDLYPETPIRTGQIRNRLAITLLRSLERLMYRRAARVAVIAPSFRDRLVAAGVPAENVTVIPNFADIDHIRPLRRDNDFARRHGLGDKFVVMHAGNVGYVYDLDTMLDAAALLAPQEDVLFLIVGDGVEKPRLQARAEALRLRNVRFLPYQPWQEVPWLRASSDVQVSLYRHGSATHSMPSKVYEIMASGRPLLASAEGETDIARLVEETGCGVCVEPEDAGELAAAVRRLHRDRESREAMGQRGRSQAEKAYAQVTVVAAFDALLGGAVRRGPHAAIGERRRPSSDTRPLVTPEASPGDTGG